MINSKCLSWKNKETTDNQLFKVDQELPENQEQEDLTVDQGMNNL
jgi:hypothetical protein